MEPICLRTDNCVFLMIDVQEKLVPAVHGGENVVYEASRLLKSAEVMKIPPVLA